ncbi:hypothetical protein BST61_g10281 [Cercospora zeina]
MEEHSQFNELSSWIQLTYKACGGEGTAPDDFFWPEILEFVKDRMLEMVSLPPDQLDSYATMTLHDRPHLLLASPLLLVASPLGSENGAIKTKIVQTIARRSRDRKQNARKRRADEISHATLAIMHYTLHYLPTSKQVEQGMKRAFARWYQGGVSRATTNDGTVLDAYDLTATPWL